MARPKRLIKSFYRLLSPTVLLSVFAVVGASLWLVFETSRPVNAIYIVTPEKYGQLSARGSQVTEESWNNPDGTMSRGWLLRGQPNEPAVILLHRYGADRSHVLNLGVKLNEDTNFTVLMPDQRGHGKNALVPYSSFGGCEADDVLSFVQYLRGLKTAEQFPLVGKEIGVYGVELGALSALSAAGNDASIKAMVLDSVPNDSDAMLSFAIGKRFPFGSSITSSFASLGAYPFYFDGCYRRVASCNAAKSVNDRRVMLLGGVDAPDFQESTLRLGKCFPVSTSVDSKTDLSPSGMNISNASIVSAESYDQRVIDFLREALTMQ
jgi:pimeloyl-ACP methyl ester carboxylesterase